MKKYFLTIVFIVVVVTARQASAAVLSFEPASVTLGPGESAVFNLKIDLTAGCINAVEGYMTFPATALAIASFQTGESILPIWVSRPSDADLAKANDTGELYFAGGVPGGYCGKIPGDPGPSNSIAKIVVTVPSFSLSDSDTATATITLGERSRVLLHDGLGTVDALLKRDAAVHIAKRPTGGGQDWSAEVDADTIPPEPFVVELYRDPDRFENRYYIVFDTTDKQTGIDRYEILEIRSGETPGEAPEAHWTDRLLRRKRVAPDWRVGAMPYPLQDQTLQSVIKVRAIDKAGNERLVEYVPSAAESAASAKAGIDWPVMAVYGAIALAGLAVVIGIFFIVRLIIKRRTHAVLPSVDDAPRPKE
jgi:hypothetical protein